MPPTLIVKVVGDTSDLEKKLNRGSRASKDFSRSVEQSGRGALTAAIGFRGLGRSVAFASGAFLGGAGLVSILKSSVDAASNLAEQTSKSTVVFGLAESTVKQWSQTTVTAMGLAEDQALETAAGFGALLRPLGLTGQEAAKQSIALSQLGADLASFSNTSVPEALAAIKSGLVGEAEPLRKYGVLLSEVRVQQEALRETGKKHVTQLTNQDKALARIAIIFKDTATAQGDFARTSGGLANQQRILQANLRQTELVLGTALIPAVSGVVKGLNDWLGKTENQKRVQRDLTETIKITGTILKDAKEVVDNVTGALGGMKHSVELLIAVLVVSKLTAFASGITGVGASSEVAAGRVEVLRGALARLALIGLITIPIELVIRRKEIDSKVTDFLNEHGLGAFTGGSQQFADAEAAARWAAQHVTDSGLQGDVAKQILKAQGVNPANNVAALGPIKPKSFPTPKNENAGAGSGASKALGSLDRAQKLALATEQARLAVARGQRGAQAELVKALKDQIDFDRKYERIQEDLIRRRVGDVGAHAKTLARLRGEEASALDEITGIEAGNAADAKAASDKRIADAKEAAKKRKDALDKQNDLIRKTIKQANDRFDRLVAAGKANNARNAARRQGRQFRELGFTSEGDVRPPTAAALQKQLGTVENAVKGTVLDTSATKGQLKRIRGVLKSEFGILTSETRSLVKELLDALTPDEKKSGPETAFKKTNFRNLLRNAGLDPAEVRRVSAALSQVGAGGKVHGSGTGAFGQPIHVHTTVTLDGKKVATNTTKHQQKTRRRNPEQKRGPFAGGRVQ